VNRKANGKGFLQVVEDPGDGELNKGKMRRNLVDAFCSESDKLREETGQIAMATAD
jgi:hypothetical protein